MSLRWLDGYSLEQRVGDGCQSADRVRETLRRVVQPECRERGGVLFGERLTPDQWRYSRGRSDGDQRGGTGLHDGISRHGRRDGRCGLRRPVRRLSLDPDRNDTGPGGTGQLVRITGREEWKLGPDDLVAESKGYFDQAEYRRQISGAT